MHFLGAFLISESMSTVTNVKYEEFKQFTKDPTALVIDVREPNEIREGAIPGAINIPCNYLFLLFFNV